VKRGTLSRMMRKMDFKLPLDLIKFYAAELILILEYLHK
jgi:serine/threonine protein kinase